MTTSFINEARLLELLPNFFSKASTVLIEIAQNAARSGATELHIKFEDGVLEAKDNGAGTDDVVSLLKLADSAWSQNVMEQESPAGWGLFHLFCISENVVLKSRFGRLEIDCNSFLRDEAYRGSILRGVSTKLPFKGFSLRAEIKPEATKCILDSAEANLAYFPLKIYLNEEELERGSIDSYSQWQLTCEYMGNRVYIDPLSGVFEWFPSTSKELAERLFTVWYGIPIKQSGFRKGVVIDVKTGTPLTPVLPYRQAIKHDEKLEDFYRFVRQKTVEFCTDYINSTNESLGSMVEAMRTMISIATDEELDRLERFYVSVTEPHARPKGHSSGTRIVARGEEVVGTVIDLYVDAGKGLVQEATDNLFLDEGECIAIDAPSRKPSWLTVKEEFRRIEIYPNECACGGYFDWYPAKIVSKYGQIKVLALVEDSNNGQVYYAASPNDFWGMADPVFDRRIVSEDFESDHWETQKNDFESYIEKDISSILGSFSRWRILDAISEASRIRNDDITSVTVTRKRLIVNGKKGRKVVLKLH